VFCITSDKTIYVSLNSPATLRHALMTRCKPHDTQQLESFVVSLRNVNAAWLQLRAVCPQLQAECDRVDAAAEAAILCIRKEAA
jgi:hypothetical protein